MVYDVSKVMVDPCYCVHVAIRMVGRREEMSVDGCRVSIREVDNMYIVYARSRDGKECVMTVW